MEQDKKQKPVLAEEQLKEVGGEGHLPKSAKVPGSSNSIEANGKRQLSDEKLADVDRGIIPPFPDKPTTSTF